jgi:hypothetical protein
MVVRLWAFRAGHPSTPQKDYFSASGTHCCQRLAELLSRLIHENTCSWSLLLKKQFLSSIRMQILFASGTLIPTCKWDFHCGDYEGCRPLGYKNPVRTSQETHCVSATAPIRLMLCKTSDFHGGDYGECFLPGYEIQSVPHRRHITSPLQSPTD